MMVLANALVTITPLLLVKVIVNCPLLVLLKFATVLLLIDNVPLTVSTTIWDALISPKENMSWETNPPLLETVNVEPP